jgi:hypothetical protein
MTAPIGNYIDSPVRYVGPDGQRRIFADERAWERFVMACAHPETVAWKGYAYCVRCLAMPWRKGRIGA